MKTIIVIRHAKSSWSNIGLEDIVRPLNERGVRDAPKMAKHLKEIIPKIDHFYSSPAVRAYATAKYFAECYGQKESTISKVTELYFGDESDMLHLINEQDDNSNSMVFFSHNPTITYFVNQFSLNYVDNIPTCGISILVSQCKSWNEINIGNLKLVKSMFPKLMQ